MTPIEITFLIIAILFTVVFVVVCHRLKLYPFYTKPKEDLKFSQTLKDSRALVTKKYVPSRTSTRTTLMYNSATKTSMPTSMPYTIPAQYLVVFNLTDVELKFASVEYDDEDLFKFLHDSMEVKLTYREGVDSTGEVKKLEMVMVDKLGKKRLLLGCK